MSTTPTPESIRKGLVESGLAKLARVRHVRVPHEKPFSIGQTVTLPGAHEDGTHKGTVSDVNHLRFEVTWQNPARKSGQPRDRRWYSWEEARHFTAVAS